MSITAIVENDTIRLPVHVPNGTSVEILLPSGWSGETAVAGLADYRKSVAEARRRFAPNCPWKTTDEAIRELRAGEQD
jgi:hypothetical protein